MSEFSHPAIPYVLPVADRALVMWLKARGIADGKPVLVQFEFRDDKLGATYLGMAIDKDNL